MTSIGNNVFENCPRTLEIWCEYNSLALQYAINNDHKYYYLTPVGVNLPFSRIYRGDPFTLYGTIYSSINISEVTATLSSGDQSTVIAQKTVNPAATSYPLSGDFSSAFNFPALALGTYHFQLYAKTSKSTEIYMDGDFQVVPPPLRVSLSGFTPPSGAVNRLSAGPITGTLSANYPLTSVRITIYDANGAATGQAYSGSPNTASFSLAASGIDLSQLADGAYRFLFTASGNGETRTVADTYFELGDFGHYAGTVDAIREFVNNKNKSEAVFGYDHSMEYKGKLAQDPNYKYKEFLNKYVVNFDQTLTNEINNFITYSYNMILSGSYVKDDQAIIDAYKLSLSAYIQSVSGYSPAHLLEADKTLVEKVINSVYQYGKINYDYISEASQATGEEIDSFTRQLGTLLSVYEKLDGANEKLKNKQYAEAVGSLVEYYAEGRRVLEALKTQYTAASSNERYQFGRAVDKMLEDFDGSMNSEVDKMINEISKKAAKKVEKAMEDFIKGASLELHYTLRLVEFTVVPINEYTGFLDCVDKANQYIMECNIYTQIAGTYGETLRKVRAGDYSQETLDKLCVTFEAAKSYALKLCDILYALDSEFYASTGDNTRKLQYLRHAFLPT